MDPTQERLRPPASRIVRRILIAGGAVGMLVYTTVLMAMTLRLPRPVELLAGAAVISLLVLLASAGWRRIDREL
ncbi:MAG TPA: hypothetical protein PLA43_12070 [Bryobacteraceae bacterium]|nr:hypothetical protein [Bryobacteraceae bacterium]HOL70697.1 hypothetical protein [Bryobacteraceae bacterium]HOQ46173.1 hypothetical protein [Bryobacteraceae bacterium]HPQ14915.1 hypothetical protein [Bryobacteraceae bacterium]HPU72686.1 hypothetical protein [Bryobacteraceae bacterium]